MPTVRHLVFSFVIVIASLPAFALDVEGLPAQVRVQHYLMEAVEATEANDNVRLAALCEKMLALKGEVSVDPVISYFYAKSLAALGQEEKAKTYAMEFLKIPDADPETVKEALVFATNIEALEKALDISYWGDKRETALKAVLPHVEYSLSAQRRVANIYSGIDGKQAEAEKWYLRAVENGLPEDQVALGNFYAENATNNDSYGNKAFELYGKAIKQGYSPAYSRFGECYYNGIGTKKDHAEALKWFHKALDEGEKDVFGDIRFQIGRVYLMGDGIAKDSAKALYWLEASAEAGNYKTMFELGEIYRRGDYVARDTVKAVQWFEKVATEAISGNPRKPVLRPGPDLKGRAAIAIGEMYENGEGMPKDYHAAQKWYLHAKKVGLLRVAEQGLARIAPFVR